MMGTGRLSAAFLTLILVGRLSSEGLCGPGPEGAWPKDSSPMVEEFSRQALPSVSVWEQKPLGRSGHLVRALVVSILVPGVLSASSLIGIGTTTPHSTSTPAIFEPSLWLVTAPLSLVGLLVIFYVKRIGQFTTGNDRRSRLADRFWWIGSVMSMVGLLGSSLGNVLLRHGGALEKVFYGTWIQQHLVDIFAGYWHASFLLSILGGTGENTSRPLVVIASIGAFLEFFIYELIITNDPVDFIVEMPALLVFTVINLWRADLMDYRLEPGRLPKWLAPVSIAAGVAMILGWAGDWHAWLAPLRALIEKNQSSGLGGSLFDGSSMNAVFPMTFLPFLLPGQLTHPKKAFSSAA